MTACRSHRSLALLAALVLCATSQAASADDLPPHEVDAQVVARFKLAAQAIRFARTAIPHAGNQRSHLQTTEGRSRSRMLLTQQIANHMSWDDTAGIVACTRGGNCGENAQLAAHYLASRDTSEPFGVYHVPGLDHAFVLIGDPLTEPANKVVVVDPWVVNPTPVLWEDYFAYHDSLKLKTSVRRIEYAAERGKNARAKRRQVRNEMRKTVNPSAWAHPVTWPHEGTWHEVSPYEPGRQRQYKGPGGKKIPTTGARTTNVRIR